MAAMTMATWIVAIGTAGGFCTTIAYVPQLMKTWKQGGRDLSYGMLVLYLVGVLLWLVYGFLLRAQAIIITNIATALLIALIIVLKAWKEKDDVPRTHHLETISGQE